jgi:DNA repair photolyase
MSAVRIFEREAKSILVKSGLPGADFVINPYTGCAFACAYCYASFMSRYVDEPIESWGSFVFVKTNAVDLLEGKLARMRPAGMEASIFFSSVTDCYQGVESRYRLTRGCLEALAEGGWAGPIGILTKSPLVLRDIDVLTRLKNAEVGMTVTTTADAAGRIIERAAPLAHRRIETLAALHAAGIATYAFVGPLMPHYAQRPERLDALFGALAGAGVREVFVEHLNAAPYIASRLWPMLRAVDPAAAGYFSGFADPAALARLDALVGELLVKHNLSIRAGGIIHHGAV